MTDRDEPAATAGQAGDGHAHCRRSPAALTLQESATPTDCTAWDVRKIALHVSS